MKVLRKQDVNTLLKEAKFNDVKRLVTLFFITASSTYVGIMRFIVLDLNFSSCRAAPFCFAWEYDCIHNCE